MQMTRLKAFLIHFSITLVIVLTVLLSASFLWYPDFYFAASNVTFPIMMVVIVDAGLGPLMTLILFKPGKPGLKFDITVVALLQIIALAIGVTIVYTERPALVVHYEGIFNCLSHSQVEKAGAKLAMFKDPQHPTLPGVAHLPKVDKQTWIAKQQELIAQGSGIFLPAYVYGEQFKPLNMSTINHILSNELDISDAIKVEPYASRWQQFAEQHSVDLAEYAYFTLVCSAYDYVLAVNRHTGELIDTVHIPFTHTNPKHFLIEPSTGAISDAN